MTNRSDYSAKSITHGWTPERVEQLQQLWGAGRSASQIGEVMNLSRNAVVGKINRVGAYRDAKLNIANRSAASAISIANGKRSPRLSRPHESKTVTPRIAKPKLVTDENSVLFERVAPRPPWTKPQEAAFDVATAPHARPWLERTGHQCMWPLDGPDGETWSCCAPTETTYCPDHRAIATTPFKPWKPKARLAA